MERERTGSQVPVPSLLPSASASIKPPSQPQGPAAPEPTTLENPNDNTEKAQLQTKLRHAVEHQHEAEVQRLLNNAANITTKYEDGRTVLHLAAERDNRQIVQLLLKKGVDTIVKDDNGLTALYWAVKFGHKPVVQLLIDKKADINTIYPNGETEFYTRKNKIHISARDMSRCLLAVANYAVQTSSSSSDRTHISQLSLVVYRPSSTVIAVDNYSATRAGLSAYRTDSFRHCTTNSRQNCVKVTSRTTR